MAGDTNSKGSVALYEAIAVLGQINILIPIGFALGKSLVELVQTAIHKGNVPQATLEEAQSAVDRFSGASQEVSDIAQNFLDNNPAEDGGE